MHKRVIKELVNKSGTISKDGGQEVSVRFSLTQWQDFIQPDLPGLKSADGIIEFEDTAKAFYFFNSGGTALLKGGGISASVIITSTTRFTVTGPVTNL